MFKMLSAVQAKRLILVAGLLLVAGCGGGGSGGTATATATATSSSSSSSSSSSDSSSSVALAALPTIAIVTDGAAPIVDEDNYIAGDMSIIASDGTSDFSGRLSIKGHGNSTWSMPKKPYRIKLDSKAGLLGMPKDKNWILLANYSDKTLLRNQVAFEFSRRLGMAWTPRSVQVELTLNGDYVGVYQLVEQVRVDSNRVNITETDDTTPANAADGGYLLEINQRMNDPVCWSTSRVIDLCIKEPDPSNADQQSYIESYLQSAEDSLFSADPTNAATGYESYFDVDSLIDWYLVNELFKNVDSADISSIYLYKDAGGKLHYGPVWDFDLGAGNTDYFDATPEGFRTAASQWIAKMKAVDPTFETRVRARWDEVKAAQIDTLPAYIDAQAALLADAEARNFARWPILDTYVWPNSEVAGSYQGEVDFFRDWMVAHIAWLDANL